MMKKILFLALFLTSMLLLTSCQSLTEEALQEKLIAANTGLNSYSFDMVLTSEIDTFAEGESNSLVTSTDIVGDFDRKNQLMSIKGVISVAGPEGPMDLDTETYITGGMLYTQTMGMWIKTPVPETMWDEQDQIKKMVEFLETGSIKRQADELIGETSYYVVKIDPDLKTVVRSILEEQAKIQLSDSMNFEKMLKSYDLTVWINKKTFVIEKVKTNVEMIVDESSLNADFGGQELSMSVISTSDITMYDFNKKVDIALPLAASSAMDLSSLQGLGDQ